MIGSVGFVSVIARNLYWPIALEVSALEAADPVHPNKLQTNSSENGHALAVVILGALTQESAINRAGYVNADRTLNPGGKLESALHYLKAKLDAHSCTDWNCPLKSFDTQSLFDIFVVRDAIAHNHLWSGEFSEDPGGNWIARRDPQPEAGFGDNKFLQYADLSTGLTKYLGLNVVPTRVWRKDAYLVLQTLFQTLEALDHIGNHLGIRDHPFVLRNKVVLYDDFVKHIDDALAALATVP